MNALEFADMIERYNAGVMSQKICEDYKDAAAELRRLHAEVESLRTDAERYRWLRDKADSITVCAYTSDGGSGFRCIQKISTPRLMRR